MYRSWYLLLVLTLLPSTASAYRTFKTPTGAYFYWPGRMTQYVVTDKELPGITNAKLVTIVDQAFLTWMLVPCAYIVAGNVGTVEARLPGFNTDGDNQNLVSWVTDKQEWQDLGYSHMQIAMTSIMTNSITGEVLDADITFNAAHFTFSTSQVPADGSTDLLNALTHEVGHYFGLDENLENEEATMYYLAKPGETKKRDLSEDDEEGICFLYPVPDSSSGNKIDDSSSDDGSSGCSVTHSSPSNSFFALLMLMALFVSILVRRHRKRESRSS